MYTTLQHCPRKEACGKFAGDVQSDVIIYCCMCWDKNGTRSSISVLVFGCKAVQSSTFLPPILGTATCFFNSQWQIICKHFAHNVCLQSVSMRWAHKNQILFHPVYAWPSPLTQQLTWSTFHWTEFVPPAYSEPLLDGCDVAEMSGLALVKWSQSPGLFPWAWALKGSSGRGKEVWRDGDNELIWGLVSIFVGNRFV